MQQLIFKIQIPFKFSLCQYRPFLLHCGIIKCKVDNGFYNGTNIIETYNFRKKGKF